MLFGNMLEMTRTYDIIVYRNSEMSTSAATISSYINVATDVFEDTYNVSFNRIMSASTTALNQRDGCSRALSLICNSSCGDVSSCKNVHHKAGYYFLYVSQSSTTKVFRYVDYALCRTKNDSHGEIYGAAVNNMDIIVTLQSPNVQRTTCHELLHWIGARDQVCVEGQACVMTYGSNVYNLWCTQCSQDIAYYLD